MQLFCSYFQDVPYFSSFLFFILPFFQIIILKFLFHFGGLLSFMMFSLFSGQPFIIMLCFLKEKVTFGLNMFGSAEQSEPLMDFVSKTCRV